MIEYGIWEYEHDIVSEHDMRIDIVWMNKIGGKFEMCKKYWIFYTRY